MRVTVAPFVSLMSATVFAYADTLVVAVLYRTDFALVLFLERLHAFACRYSGHNLLLCFDIQVELFSEKCQKKELK
jgi:archaellum biogenesis protein FlaJ (TadC family)